MSIIYKALQKTQKNLENKSQSISETKTSSRKHLWFDIALMIIIATLLILAGYTYFPLLHFHKKTVIVQPVDIFNEMDFRNKYQVNGVFVSDQNKFVMINSQPYHIGDYVGGLMIVSIDYHDIKLQNANHVVMLKVPV